MDNKISNYEYQLYLNNKPLDEYRIKCITDLELKEVSSGSSSLVFKVSDPNMVFIDDNIYNKSVPVEFIANMYMRSVHSFCHFWGYISAIDINFPDKGIPEMTIYCMDYTYRLNAVERTRSWKNVKISDVVAQIIRPYGYVPHIHDTIIKEESISQSNQTDIAFLKDLSNKLIEPFVCYIQGKHFYFQRKNLAQIPKRVLGYKTGNFEVISFNPQITKENKKQEVTSQNISLLTAQVKSHVTTDMNIDRQVQGKPFKR